MYKMVRGKVEELEKLMNEVFSEGYTELFREFPDDNMSMPEPPKPPKPSVYFFLMKKPASISNQIQEYTKMLRQMAVALGLGDRLPPEPTSASILNLVSKEKKDE